MIRIVPTGEYPALRDKVRKHLEAFVTLSCGDWTLEGLDRDISAGRLFLILINDGQAAGLAALTNSSVEGHAIAGKGRADWQEELDDVMRDWARRLGKRRVRIFPRRGWWRFLESRGYRQTEIVAEVKIQ